MIPERTYTVYKKKDNNWNTVKKGIPKNACAQHGSYLMIEDFLTSKKYWRYIKNLAVLVD